MKKKNKRKNRFVFRRKSSQKNGRFIFENSRNRGFEDFLEHVSDLVQSVDKKGNFIYVNKKWCKTLGYTKKEVQKLNLKDIIRRDQLKHCLRIFRRVIKGKSADNIETIFVSKKGREVPIEGNVNAQFKGRKLIATRGIFRDISKRRKEEKLLKKVQEDLEKKVTERTAKLSQFNELLQKEIGDRELVEKDMKKFKLAVENAYDNIIITDPNGIVIFANAATEKVTGFSGREVLDKKAGGRDMWGGLMPYEYYQNLWKVIKKDKKTFVSEFKNRRKNGELYDAEVNIAPILDKNGKALYFVGIERDVTELRKIDRAKTELISLASHQLRTPLSTVKWYTEMLISGDAGQPSEEQRKYLEEIYKGNQRMIDLVNSLLNVSRIDLGTLAIEPEPTNLIALADDVVGEFKFRIQEKRITVEFNHEKLFPLINLDPRLMRIVFQNLISNALRYTSQGGKITVSIVKRSSDILITIKDNGCGIPKNQQSRIFERLFRADNARAIDAEGTGLGLYIVKAVIDQSGGKIWFESQEGKGTTFYITMPLGGMSGRKGTKGLVYSG